MSKVLSGVHGSVRSRVIDKKMSYFIARPANSHDSALTLMIFFTFHTASQDYKSHIFLENIFLK